MPPSLQRLHNLPSGPSSSVKDALQLQGQLPASGQQRPRRPLWSPTFIPNLIVSVWLCPALPRPRVPRNVWIHKEA